MMKKRLAAWLAAGLVATAAWGQNLVGSVEIRGLEDFLDAAMTVTAGTPLEGRPAMLPAMLQGAFGINVLQLVEPHGTIRCDIYEKEGEALFRLALPVDDPEAFFGKLGPGWTEVESAEGEEVGTALRTFAQDYGNGAKGRALSFRGEAGHMFVMLREDTDAEVMARGAEPALDIAGVWALWFNAEFLQKMTQQQTAMPGGWEFEDMLFGLALPDGDKLELNFSAGCNEAMAASLPEGEPGADVHMVNLPGAIAASVSKTGSPDYVENALNELKKTFSEGGMDLPEAFWEFCIDFERTFADGDTGVVLLSADGEEGGVPECALYLTPKNPGEVRKAIAEKSQEFLDKILEAVEGKEEGGESPLQFVSGGVRTAAGAEIDTWTLSLADTEENREDAEENGWTLPKELVTFEVAWLDNGAMVVSTLGGGKLEGMLARRIDGTLVDFSEAEAYTELFGAGQRAPWMGFVKVMPCVRAGVAFLKGFDEDFTDLDGVLADLPQVELTMAVQAERVGDRRLNESLRVKLQDVKDLVLYGLAQLQQRAMQRMEEDEEEEVVDFEFEEEGEEIDFDAEDAEDAEEEAAEEAEE